MYVHVVRFGKEDNRCLLDKSLQASVDCQVTYLHFHLSHDTVWLTQQQLTELYQCSKSNISEHIKHIFEEGELDKDSVVRKFRTTADDGKTYNVTYYNLDMIISLGFQVNYQH